MTTKNKICPWAGEDPLYVKYHNEEWGVPQYDDRLFFEKLLLEGFQAGLSWITILRKRENFRKAFDGFDPQKLARYSDAKIDKLMLNEGIIRHRGKIESTRHNARAYLALREKTTLSDFLWNFMDGSPVENKFKTSADIPPQTPVSLEISKALKKEGFKFVGPTTVYAFMQSMGFVNDHLVSCIRHKECAKLAKNFKPRSASQQ